jgi:hypothetical protein
VEGPGRGARPSGLRHRGGCRKAPAVTAGMTSG